MAKKKPSKTKEDAAAEITGQKEEAALESSQEKESGPFSAFFSERTNLYICFGIAIICLLIYGQTAGFGFINTDDPGYIYENPVVLGGLSWASIKWAFTTFHFANWHPLTWLSYLIDTSLFGADPGAYHFVNVAFHTINSVLLFFVVKYLTGCRWRSAIVAGLFAFHPAHAESAAWISERKDVLSTFFWFLATYFYIRYARAGRAGIAGGAGERGKLYIFCLIAFILGSMAKPMLVTLPFTFLLLDYWALERLEKFSFKDIFPLIKEKIPLFAISAASSIVTILAQKAGGSIESLEYLPFLTRVLNAFVSYAKYLVMFFFPANLGFSYPYEKDLPLWQIAGSVLLLALISVFVIKEANRRKYLFAGWFWFLGTLIPVIGLLQVGRQALADRYTYIPYIGLSIAVVWLIGDLLKKIEGKKLLIASAAVLAVLAGLTFQQVSYWKDSETLYRRSLAISKGDAFIEQNLCQHLIGQKRFDEAEIECKNAIEHQETYANAHISMGIINFQRKNFDEAAKNFRRALEIRPDNFGAYSNLAKALLLSGNLDEAAEMTQQILQNFPATQATREVLIQNYTALGFGYAQKNDYLKSALFLQQGLELNPANPDMQANLGFMLSQAGKPNEGLQQIDEAIKQSPGKPEYYNLKGLILASKGAKAEAIAAFERALELKPGYPAAQDNLNKLKGQK